MKLFSRVLNFNKEGAKLMTGCVSYFAATLTPYAR